VRRLALAGTAAAALAALGTTSAPAATLPLGTALQKTASIARAKGLQAGASNYYAFGCQRRTAQIVDCIGVIAFADGSGCGQVVRVSYAKSKAAAGRLIGQPLCGSTGDGSVPAPSDSSGSGGETAICAIHQSVCISG
jgi:hypothetical protein